MSIIICSEDPTFKTVVFDDPDQTVHISRFVSDDDGYVEIEDSGNDYIIHLKDLNGNTPGGHRNIDLIIQLIKDDAEALDKFADLLLAHEFEDEYTRQEALVSAYGLWRTLTSAFSLLRGEPVKKWPRMCAEAEKIVRANPDLKALLPS